MNEILSYITSTLDFFYRDLLDKPLFYATMVLSILGAKCAAGRTARMRGAGFLVWVFSNGYIGYSFLIENNYPMIVTYLFYEYYNIQGINNNWMKKT